MLLGIAFVGLFTRCGAVPSMNSDAGTQDAGAGDSGTQDASIAWPVSASEVVATRFGGFFAGNCTLPDAGLTTTSSWKIDLLTKGIVFSQCPANTPGSNPPLRTGTRMLSDSQLASFDTSMKALKRSPKTQCGADKENLNLRVESPAGTQLYKDSFYACQANGTSIVAVDGIDEVFSTIASFTIP
jgi:hypothetical protein